MTFPGTIPHNGEIESAFIGGCLAFRDRIEQFVDVLAAEDFYVPRNAVLWGAITELHRTGKVIDVPTVVDAVQRLGTPVEGPDLIHLMNESLPPRPQHAEILQRHTLARSVQGLCVEALDGITDGSDPAEVADHLATGLAQVDSPLVAPGQRAVTLDELVAGAKDRSPWIVPGMLRVGWRAIVVAGEGRGKSTILRQVGACSAQGVHPFRLTRMPPIRVLVIDAENDDSAIAETGAPLVAQLRRTVGDAYDPDRIHVLRQVGGWNLRLRRDRLEVEAEIRRLRPDLIVAGPLYQLFSRRDRERDDDATEPLLKVLDGWRARYGCAPLIEHHAPHGTREYREMRPYGSTVLLRWPELGIGLSVDKNRSGGDLELSRWRGDRLLNDWPAGLVRGSVWPWAGRWDKPEPLATEEGMF